MASRALRWLTVRGPPPRPDVARRILDENRPDVTRILFPELRSGGVARISCTTLESDGVVDVVIFGSDFLTDFRKVLREFVRRGASEDPAADYPPDEAHVREARRLRYARHLSAAGHELANQLVQNYATHLPRLAHDGTDGRAATEAIGEVTDRLYGLRGFGTLLHLLYRPPLLTALPARPFGDLHVRITVHGYAPE